MSSRWSVKMIQVLKGFMTTEVSVMSFVVTQPFFAAVLDGNTVV